VILDPHAVKIFTDGSCYRNPGGLSGCAAIVEYPDEWQRRAEQIVDYGVAESSINRMELLAWNRSIEWIIKESSNLSGARIQLITDSQYVHQNTARAASWRNNSWRNYDGDRSKTGTCGNDSSPCVLASGQMSLFIRPRGRNHPR
jgi:ribonuclease HI